MNVKKSLPLRRYLSWRMSWLAILTGGVVGVAALLFLALPLAHERAMARLETYAEEISETLRTELTVMARALHLFVERLPGGDYQHGWLPFAAAAQQVTQVFPLVTSVVVGNSSGQGIAWLDLPGMRRIRLTDPLLWESEHRFIELDAALQPQKSYWQALDYDPRQRAWYQRASASIGAVVLTDPYVFYTTRELGVTLTTARKLGEAIEAIGFDVRLTELVQHVHRLAAAQGVRLLLLDGSEQVLAESTSASLWWDRDGKLVRLANLSDPLWQSVPGTGGDWRWAHGQWWQVQALPVEIVGGTRWELVLRQDLRVALQQGTVQAWLQPQVWLRDGSLRGAEVLARWQHPQKGWVPPPQFVAVAESHGLIAELTLEMLRQGIAAWKELRSVGIELPCVAVNVSPVVLRDVGFASAALALLGQESIPPAALELEITETVMLDTDAVQEALHTLEAAGVRLAVDDFGTGYASFGYLNEIRFDVLKIDASFVRDLGVLPAADALVQGLVHIGQTLGLELLAEGVETAQQAQRLKEMGVRSAQGYGFGKPMPVGTWPQWWEDYQQVRKAFSA